MAHHHPTVMRLIFAICTLALLSCAPDSTPIPACDYAQITYDGHKAHITITSDLPEITICRDFGRCFTCSSHYYHCISMSADPGEMITLIADGAPSTLTVPDINPQTH